MSDFTIKQIFQDHWNDFLINNSDIKLRQVVFDEVDKIINCGNPDFGYALYVCEHCGKFLKVPFRCKSRFCNTCGVKYAQDRALSMAKKSIRCKHRHIVFTMSDLLWPYFQKYRFLLNGLFDSVSKAVLSWFYELNKSQIEIREQLRKWNLSIELSFGYDPTICKCGGHLIFFELKLPNNTLQNIS